MFKWFKKTTNKFYNAFRGLVVVVKEEKSLWVHIFVTIMVVIFGVLFKLDATQWALVTLAIGLVIGFELLNTAIEYVVDVISFEYSIKAKKIKDVAAMATLFVTIVAIIIGLLVFIPAINSFVGA